MGGWSKRVVEVDDGQVVRLSVVFTWDLPVAYQRAVWWRQLGRRVLAGGPAVDLMSDYLADVAEVGGRWDGALEQHNPLATFTSRGCVRRCSFCAVWRVEGELRELEDWPVGPVVCDNNLLACSVGHFDRVVDRLRPVKGVDFNQGLDARLLTEYHAGRLAELDCKVRLAVDSIGAVDAFVAAFEKLKGAGFPNKRIGVYVLIGYKDTPEDALERLRLVTGLGVDPFVMRFNPLDALRRDAYVAEGWTDSELRRFVRYWSNLRYFRAVPFGEFR